MTTVVGAGPSATPLPRARRRLLGVSVLAVALIAAVSLSLLVGANPLSVDALLDTLAGNGTPETAYVLYDLRIPRTAVGLAAGAALGIAGALIQAFTRNPLADPGILGVNAGAALAVAIGVAWLGLRDASAFIWLAFLGALIVTVAVYLVGSAGRGAADPLRLTLAGVALGAVLSGITTGLTLTDPEAFDTLRSWNAGSLLASGLDDLVAVLPFLGVGVVIALAATGGLNALALGEDVARAQGANVALLRTGVIVAVTLLAGTATALAGPIAFVGLMVPHVIRWTVGVDQRLIVPLSAVLAPVVVLLSDVVGRVIIAPAEVPVGVVAALVGAPVLIVLARRRKASSL